MAVIIKEGNVFDSDAKIICHQVNCQGVMGSGVAKEVKERYPNVYTAYHNYCEENKDCPARMLGVAQMVPVDEECSQWIANCFGQNGYGYDGKQYTSVVALMDAFKEVARLAKASGVKVAMPYGIGCVRGGARWALVKEIIDVTFKDVDVELWKLEGK